MVKQYFKAHRVRAVFLLAFIAIVLAILIWLTVVTISAYNTPDRAYITKSETTGNTYSIRQHPGAISPFFNTKFSVTATNNGKAVANQKFSVDTSLTCSGLFGARACNQRTARIQSDSNGEFSFKYRGGPLTTLPNRDYQMDINLVNNTRFPTFDAFLFF